MQGRPKNWAIKNDLKKILEDIRDREILHETNKEIWEKALRKYHRIHTLWGTL